MVPTFSLPLFSIPTVNLIFLEILFNGTHDHYRCRHHTTRVRTHTHTPTPPWPGITLGEPGQILPCPWITGLCVDPAVRSPAPCMSS